MHCEELPKRLSEEGHYFPDRFAALQQRNEQYRDKKYPKKECIIVLNELLRIAKLGVTCEHHTDMKCKLFTAIRFPKDPIRVRCPAENWWISHNQLKRLASNLRPLKLNSCEVRALLAYTARSSQIPFEKIYPVLLFYTLKFYTRFRRVCITINEYGKKSEQLKDRFTRGIDTENKIEKDILMLQKHLADISSASGLAIPQQNPSGQRRIVDKSDGKNHCK